MHDGTIAQGDSWLRAHLSGYASWAASHRSLLIVTWDEDDRSAANQIPTFVVGAGVRASQVGRHLTLYSLLRLIESRYGLPLLGRAATAPVLDVGPVPK
jgi:acid phosphatase